MGTVPLAVKVDTKVTRVGARCQIARVLHGNSGRLLPSHFNPQEQLAFSEGDYL